MTLYRLGYITSYKSSYKKLQKRELELILERHAEVPNIFWNSKLCEKAGIVSNRRWERYGEMSVGLRTLRPSGAGGGLFESWVKGRAN